MFCSFHYTNVTCILLIQYHIIFMFLVVLWMLFYFIFWSYFACMSNTLDFYILSCNLQICPTHFYAKWCFCRIFRMFSVYYSLLCIFSVFCEWEEFDFFPSKCNLFSSFLALLQLWELSVQCWLEIEKNWLFKLSLVKCNVRWGLICYFWCTLLNWGSFFYYYCIKRLNGCWFFSIPFPHALMFYVQFYCFLYSIYIYIYNFIFFCFTFQNCQ